MASETASHDPGHPTNWGSEMRTRGEGHGDHRGAGNRNNHHHQCHPEGLHQSDGQHQAGCPPRPARRPRRSGRRAGRPRSPGPTPPAAGALPAGRRRSETERLWAAARRSTAGQTPWPGEAVWWVPKSCFMACPWVVAGMPPVADHGPRALPKDESVFGKVRIRSLGHTVGSRGRDRIGRPASRPVFVGQISRSMVASPPVEPVAAVSPLPSPPWPT